MGYILLSVKLWYNIFKFSHKCNKDIIFTISMMITEKLFIKNIS